MEPINSILSLQLKAKYFGLLNNEINLRFESVPNRDRSFYIYCCKVDSGKSFGFEVDQSITGQYLLGVGMRIKIYLKHTSILHANIPTQCIAIVYDREIALKGTDKFQEFEKEWNDDI